ncbi:uncharacterized protein [Malus domestica]|uniref:uncharacterized protein n=1 Tax=Malus domestica TaxID=3750 RepID=UPI0039747B92
MRTHIGSLTHSNRSQIYDGMLSTLPHNEEEHATRTNRHVRQSRGRRNHNCARNYNENRGILGCRLPAPTTCSYCYARLFTRETLNMCCLKGRVALPPIQSPPEMVALFSDQTNEGRHFRQNIRAYNHAFSFTSMGVHVDERINISGRGIYTFRAQGALYHKIGGLLPHEGNRPRFLQAYIYDTEHEVENQMCESEVLDRRVVEKIQQMLNNHNPFVHTLRSLGQRQDLPNCKLILKEQPIDRRQYSLPSASQVAAIIIDGDDATIANGRDIVVETISGRLSHVRDYVGFYDPLQYPLLLPYGTYGWDVNSRDDGGRAITCCDYYAYMLQVCTNNIIYFPIYINE